MDTSTGEVRMLDDEIVERINAAHERIKNLKQIDMNLLTPTKRQELMKNGHVKVGRNDPCPCGAFDSESLQRKKFKKCCLSKKGATLYV